MKLIRLKLENFRQHRDSTIEFSEGMTAIVGANGSGKTTILEAITFALYGVQRRTKDTLKFYWAEPRTKVRVSLDFEFDGRTYSIDRSDKDASLVDLTGGLAVTKATGLSQVKASVEKLIRLNYEQFKNSFCAEQKSLAFLQFNTDSRRQQEVAKMLGFDRLRMAGDTARERYREFNRWSEALARQIGDPDQIKWALKDAKSELKSATETAKHLKDVLAALDKELAPAGKRKADAEAWNDLASQMREIGGKADGLKQNVKTTEAAFVAAQKDEARWGELQPVLLEHAALEKQLKELQQLRERDAERQRDAVEADRLREEIARAETGLAEAQPTISLQEAEAAEKSSAEKALAAAEECRAANEAWQARKSAAQQVLATARQASLHVDRQLKTAEDLAAKGICPTCEQPTTASFEGKLQLLRQESDEAKQLAEAAASEAKKTEPKPKDVLLAEHAAGESQKRLEDARRTLQACQTATQIVAEKKRALLELQERFKSLEKKLADKQVLFDAETLAAAEQRMAKLKPLHLECLRLQGADKRLKDAEAAFTKARTAVEAEHAKYLALKQKQSDLPVSSSQEAGEAILNFQTLERQVADARVSHAKAESSVGEKERQFRAAEKKLEEYKKNEEDLNLAKSKALLHEVAAKEMALLREELNSQIRPDLEARASENLSVLTNGRYPQLILDEDFNATIVEDEVRKQVISGGEEDVVALALRLSLSELIQERQGRPMSLLILDEVFGSLDVDRRQAVLERLHAIKNRFEQVLVISHIEEINQVADQCIFLARDSNGRGTVIGQAAESDDLLLLS